MNVVFFKRLAKCLLLASGLSAIHSQEARGDVFSFTNTWSGGDLVIPDGQPAGVVDTMSFLLPEPLLITKVSLTLEIFGTGGGGFNGDLFATLTHGSGYSVLLNRVGRQSDNLSGYSDSGFASVTFDDSATGDVHLYRQILFGNGTTALDGPLTGTWQPDGRTTDPDSVLTGDPRTASLSSFTNEIASGEWTLFLADLSPGGESRLQSWRLEITAVPEPSVLMMGMLGGAALLIAGHRNGVRSE